MNQLLFEVMKVYVLPVIFAIGAGVLSGKFTRRKTIDKEIEEKVKKLCGDCIYRKEYFEAEVEEKRMAIARRIYSDFYTALKSDFLEYLAGHNFVKKDNALECKQFELFEKCCGFISEMMLTEIRIQFKMNSINLLSSLDIDDRVLNLWNKTIKIFDMNYKTKLKPTRVDLYDMYEMKKDLYTNILKKIYFHAKEIKPKK